jgi:predicted amidophosphoribosyltransferase
VALQKRTFTSGRYSVDHFYLCHYRPKSSGHHDRLSQSLLRFKNGLEPDVRAWVECSVSELSKVFANSNATVMRALGHDEITSNETNSITRLCAQLSKEIGLSDGCRALRKKKQTSKLSLLSMRQRFQETLGNYSVDSKFIQSNRILVVDDILTTGATMASIVSAIHEALPAPSIKLFTFAFCEHFSDLNLSLTFEGTKYNWRSSGGWRAMEHEEVYLENYSGLRERIMSDRF